MKIYVSSRTWTTKPPTSYLVQILTKHPRRFDYANWDVPVFKYA